MDSLQYKKNVERLREIEALVRDPGSGLGDIDKLLDETRRLVTECFLFTRGLSEKVAQLDAVTPDSVVPLSEGDLEF